MLSEIQKINFTTRAKQEVQKLLKELKIERLNDDNLGDLLLELDVSVSGLVSLKECDNREIDEGLLKIYDLLTDIVLDNENDLGFLNQLFFN